MDLALGTESLVGWKTMAYARLFFIPTFRRYESPTWQPAVDIYRHPRGWLIKCDVAGVRSEDIRMTVSHRRLHIARIRRDFSRLEQAEVYSPRRASRPAADRAAGGYHERNRYWRPTERDCG